MQQAVNRYYETQIKTATPEELTLMLYNSCIRFLKQAYNSVENRDYQSKNSYVTKAINIIDELHATLNMNYDISKSLASLYEYFKQRLVHASMRLDLEVFQEIIDLVTDLRDTWHEAIKTVKQK
ncbi:flagellar export chaperone FliS [Paenibacillus sp. AK002]|uniref:flagellar export chaperone FliS n=1 Tax=Paenibacillus lautus TaxID=1401 RepID=UPI002DBF29D1|nr:flagellar export chaperone FliS [Paenibacillus lautus]MEC0258343.1 flagellar export chaperone FliS [Paenibacillus lautus]